MKKAAQLFATATLLVIPTLMSRAQTPPSITSGTATNPRLHDILTTEYKYDPTIRARIKAAKTQAPKTNTPPPADQPTPTSAPPADHPKPDVIMEPMIVTAKRDPFVQTELARTDNLIAVLEQKTKVSAFEEVINNPNFKKIPLLGGNNYEVRVASVRADIARLQQQQLYLRLMQAARTPEEYQSFYAMWFWMRYGKEAPASKIKKLMDSEAVKSRFPGTSTTIGGTTAK